MAGLWLAGNWQPVGWTLVAVVCLLWLPYALAAEAPGMAAGGGRLRRRQPPRPPQGARPADLASPPAGRDEAPDGASSRAG
jgi:hypothetical protein